MEYVRFTEIQKVAGNNFITFNWQAINEDK